jgi:predicted amidophosphoribosyltransferase
MRHFPEVCHRCGSELTVISNVCTECLQWYCDECLIAHYDTMHSGSVEEPLVDRVLTLFDMED